jgi:hypothetical protein
MTHQEFTDFVQASSLDNSVGLVEPTVLKSDFHSFNNSQSHGFLRDGRAVIQWTALQAAIIKPNNSSKWRVLAADAVSYTQTPFLIQNKSSKRVSSNRIISQSDGKLRRRTRCHTPRPLS